MTVSKRKVASDAAETVEEPNATKATEEKKEPVFTVGKLRENSVQLFGVTQSTFDGAMYGHSEVEYTIKQVGDIINKWLYGEGGKK